MDNVIRWPSARDEIEYWKTMYSIEQVAGARQEEEVGRLSAILAALREPSEAVLDAVWMRVPLRVPEKSDVAYAIRVAVAAAEQEVNA